MPGRNVPARARLQPVGGGEVGDLVVTLGEVPQALAELVLRGFGTQAEEGVGIIGPVVVVLHGEKVRFGFSHQADQLRVRLPMVHVVREGALVVEELRIHGPALVGVPDPFPDDRAFQLGDGVAEGHLLHPGAVLDDHEAQTLVPARLRTVVRGSGGGKPPLIDPAPLPAERVIIGGMELDPPPGNAEETRDPSGRQAQDAFALF